MEIPWASSRGIWPSFGTTESEFRSQSGDTTYANWIAYWNTRPVSNRRKNNEAGVMGKIGSLIKTVTSDPASIVLGLAGGLLKKGKPADKLQAGTNVFAATQAAQMGADLIFGKSGMDDKPRPNEMQDNGAGNQGPNINNAFPDGDRPGETGIIGLLKQYWYVGVIILAGWLYLRKK